MQYISSGFQTWRWAGNNYCRAQLLSDHLNTNPENDADQDASFCHRYASLLFSLVFPALGVQERGRTSGPLFSSATGTWVLCLESPVAGQAFCRTKSPLFFPINQWQMSGEVWELQDVGQPDMQYPTGNCFFIKVYLKPSSVVLCVCLYNALCPSTPCLYPHSLWIIQTSLLRLPGCFQKHSHEVPLWPL